MDNPRCYGSPPYRIVLIHGGPGAAGSMQPVAQQLSQQYSVLEPLQTADSVAGQVAELVQQIKTHTSEKVVLIGASWGAMLGIILAAEHPALVEKLVLVGSGVYEECHARHIETTRFERLNPAEVKQAHQLMAQLVIADPDQQNNLFAQLGTLFNKSDAYEPISVAQTGVTVRYDIYKKVWPEVVALRHQGAFFKWGQKIQCPVIAIHGDYDPHPSRGIREPLNAVIADFQFVLLEKCGHEPWMETYAREKFYQQLEMILR